MLKKFAVDRNFEGDKPELVVSSPHTIKLDDGIAEMTDDVLYTPRNEPENHQVIFDNLKNYDIIPEDSQINDYQFLFSFEK